MRPCGQAGRSQGRQAMVTTSLPRTWREACSAIASPACSSGNVRISGGRNAPATTRSASSCWRSRPTAAMFGRLQPALPEQLLIGGTDRRHQGAVPGRHTDASLVSPVSSLAKSAIASTPSGWAARTCSMRSPLRVIDDLDCAERPGVVGIRGPDRCDHAHAPLGEQLGREAADSACRADNERRLPRAAVDRVGDRERCSARQRQRCSGDVVDRIRCRCRRRDRDHHVLGKSAPSLDGLCSSTEHASANPQTDIRTDAVDHTREVRAGHQGELELEHALPHARDDEGVKRVQARGGDPHPDLRRLPVAGSGGREWSPVGRTRPEQTRAFPRPSCWTNAGLAVVSFAITCAANGAVSGSWLTRRGNQRLPARDAMMRVRFQPGPRAFIACCPVGGPHGRDHEHGRRPAPRNRRLARPEFIALDRSNRPRRRLRQ